MIWSMAKNLYLKKKKKKKKCRREKHGGERKCENGTRQSPSQKAPSRPQILVKPDRLSGWCSVEQQMASPTPCLVAPLWVPQAGPGPAEAWPCTPVLRLRSSQWSCHWISKLDILGTHPSCADLKSWGGGHGKLKPFPPQGAPRV